MWGVKRARGKRVFQIAGGFVKYSNVNLYTVKNSVLMVDVADQNTNTGKILPVVLRFVSVTRDGMLGISNSPF